ncbi:succinylglutamate desuccinylase/aspartoacylase family protein [Robiginitalea sp. IMCC44478]|uniref:succinylglutamate desuccinylase/aspartoacylase family protein n=1 Tax=Robiginitalea sp. IMCC44478 TaxID=3459122 RepID=UPI004042DE23
MATNRLIGKTGTSKEGPTLVVFGGIHGNEPAGVKALNEVFKQLKAAGTPPIRGSFIGIRGNPAALSANKRFLKSDLNRLWTKPNLAHMLLKRPEDLEHEEAEALEIRELLFSILKRNSPPFYFIDLHTTSSPTLPFITINDAMINRKFSRLFPVPVILGIEEFLEGPMLSYINELGYVSLGFESGQHQDPEAIVNARAFIWQTLIYTGLLEDSEVPLLKEEIGHLNKASGGNRTFYEVYHRHLLDRTHDFRMEKGFASFQKVKKGELLAKSRGGDIHMSKDGMIFMPLYQEQGEEGFFLIRPIPDWALQFSAWLRKRRFQDFLHWLPGISWQDPGGDKIKVNLRIARFFSKQIFHLLGYRSKQADETHLILSNRERNARNSDYSVTSWYRNKA